MTTQDRLKKLLFYDPDTGIFLRETRAGKRGKPGEVAGSVNNATGYICISIDGKRKHLGCFETEQEASDVYQKALTELNKIKENKNEYRL